MSTPMKVAAQSQAVQFINENRAGALATADETGKPDVAIVYCVVTEDLKIYFSTRVEGRKYINVVARPDISLAFHNESRLQTIRLCGKAHRVDNILLEQEIIGQLFKLWYRNPAEKLPTLQLFEKGFTNELAVVEIIPDEMTFADFDQPRKGVTRPVFTRII